MRIFRVVFEKGGSTNYDNLNVSAPTASAAIKKAEAWYRRNVEPARAVSVNLLAESEL